MRMEVSWIVPVVDSHEYEPLTDQPLTCLQGNIQRKEEWDKE